MATRRDPDQACRLLARRLGALARDVQRLAPEVRETLEMRLGRAAEALDDLRQARRAVPVPSRRGGVPADVNGSGVRAAPYAALLDAALHGVAVLDDRGVIQSANAVASALLRVPARELKGRALAEFVATDERPAFRRRLASLRRSVSRQSLQCELVLRSAAGDTFTCAFFAVPQRTRTRKLRRLWCLLCDVTARQQAREALVEARATAQQYLDVAGVMLVALNRAGRIVMLNRKGAQMLGCKGDEALGLDWFTHFLPDEDRERMRHVFEQVTAGDLDGCERFENYVLTRQGQRRLIAWNNVVLSDDAGRFVGTLSSGEDVTERRAAEAELMRYRDRLEGEVAQRAGELADVNDLLLDEISARERAAAALQESEERYRALVESAGEAIVTVDYSGTFRFMNSMAAAALGGKPENFIGRTMWDLFPLLHAERQVESVRRVMRTGQSEALDSVSEIRGQDRYFHTTVAPLSDKDGNITAALVIARDVTAQRKAADALRASEERYRTLVESADEVIGMLDPDGVCLFMNSTAAKGLGGVPEDFVGRTVHELFPTEVADQQLECVRRVVRSGQGESLESIREIRGTTRHLHSTIAPVSDGRGGVAAVLVIARDVTEQRKAADALRASEERYRLLFGAIVDGVVVHNTASDRTPGPIVDLNDAACRTFGYSREELIGHEITEFVAPERLALGRTPAIVNKLRSGQPVRFESLIVRKDGTRVPIEVCSSCIEVAGECSVLSLVRDITERQLAEEALRASQALYSTTVDAITDPIHVLDGDLRLTLFSQAFVEWCRRLGIKPGELGQGLFDVFPFLPPGVRSEYQRVFTTGETLRTIETCRVAGCELVTETRKIPVLEGGKVARVVTVIQDITELKRAEETLRRSREQLRELAARLADAEEAERRRLAAELHDQIGQDLTALGINLNLLAGAIPADRMPDVKGRLTSLMELVEELAERVRGVMAQLRPPVLDDYGLSAALRWYADELSRRHGISCRLDVAEIEPRLPLRVETALFRIAQEACNNVVKYARTAELSMAFSEAAGTVALAVTDRGVGFEPGAAAGPDGANRWGLVIMRERALSVGGQMALTSAPGHGTTVTVTVPRQGG